MSSARPASLSRLSRTRAAALAAIAVTGLAVSVADRTPAHAAQHPAVHPAVRPASAVHTHPPMPTPPTSRKGRPLAANPTNPLARVNWGVATAPHEAAYDAYAAAHGPAKHLYGLIAGQPKAHWFGNWTKSSDITRLVQNYILSSTNGNPGALVQFTVFRESPWEKLLCTRLPTKAEVASYYHWINLFARAIGRTNAAIILQPDGPFAFCAPHGSLLPSHLVAYAAKRFSAQPNTSVYIEAGSADWESPARGSLLLRRGGIQYARGFALNTTHYDSTPSEIMFGQRIIRDLARHGVRDKHFVINTVDNGAPFTYQNYPGPNHGTPKVCTVRGEHKCVTLGIPPTWHVADPRWKLPKAAATVATHLVDGYLWYGRPWLLGQIDPFLPGRALNMARTTPFQR